MKRSRFSEEQIIGILKEHEAGVSVADLCRKHGVSDASIYKWKAKFGVMEVSEAKRLKTLEDENTRLAASSSTTTPSNVPSAPSRSRRMRCLRVGRRCGALGHHRLTNRDL
jgi:putative transposase